MGEGWFGGRKEPTLEARPKGRARGEDLRADPRDRPGAAPRKRAKGERIEPEFEETRRGAPRVERDDPPARGRGGPRDEDFDDDDFDDETPPPARVKKSRGKSTSAPQRRSALGFLAYWCLVLGVWGVVGAVGVTSYYAVQLPPIDQLAVPKRPPNIAILGDDGVLLANRGDTGGAAVRLGDLPPYLPKAFIAIEDRRFYSHFGVDPMGIARALTRNLLHRGGNVEGGSTLTQQLAKNLFLTQERTMARKIQEAILSIWLEHKYSKDQILELYLNRVYFGSGAYGIEAAARKYFGHSAREVTLPEAALLAGLMKAPTKLAPNRNPTGASERAAQVITAMAREGHITEAMAKLALSRPAEATHDRGAGSINYAADLVTDALDETVGAIDEDIVVTTTLNAGMQAAAERALTENLDKQGAKYGVSQGALVAMDVGGQIRALVGGRSYADSQFNRAVAAKRQPGSSFKPFVYLSALERGLTPDTVREDAPINIKGWQPENSSRQFYGQVTLTQALSMSLNTVAVRLAQEVGPKAVVATAHRLGISSDLQPNASIALGTSEVTPLELVGAYAPFANGGIGVQPHIIVKVRTADGKLLYQRKGASYGRIIDPQYVSMMNAMMRETLTTGTAKKAELPGWQAAGKTGTSQDYRDAWFVGYTSQLVAGVWLGNDDNSPTKKASGANLPVDIWSRFMKEALKSTPPTPLPSGLWRDATQPTPPPSFRPPADVPAPMANASLSQSAGPMQLSGGRLAPTLVQSRPAPSPVRPGAPRHDPIADLLPPASIPSTSAGRATPPLPEKGFLERIFGG
jgi:penicillin-binding protein 1A